MFIIEGKKIWLIKGDSLNAVLNMWELDGTPEYPADGDTITFTAEKGETTITKTIPHDTMMLSLEPDDTEDLDYGTYPFRVDIVRADDSKDTFINGGELYLVDKMPKRGPVPVFDAYAPFRPPFLPPFGLNGILSPGGAQPVDDELSNDSEHPVQNKVIYTALDGKVDKVDGKGLSANDFTNEYKAKLDGIEAQANKITVDSALSGSSENPVQNKVINTALSGKVDKVAGKGLSKNDFTDAYVTKLSGIEAGAEVNDITDVQIAGTSIVASKIANIPDATTSVKGVTVVNSSITQGSTNPVQGGAIYTALAGKVDVVDGKGLSANDFTDAYKTKLDGIAAGATAVTVDSSLIYNSTNPVQNQVVYGALGTRLGENILYNGLPHSESNPKGWKQYRASSSISVQLMAGKYFQIVFPTGITAAQGKVQLHKYLITNGTAGEGPEMDRIQSGDTIYVSFELNSDVKLANVKALLGYSVYTGGSTPDLFYLINTSSNATGGEWATFKGSGTVPAWWNEKKTDQYTKDLGLIIDTTVDSSDFDGTAAKTVKIRNIKLEFGNIATPFCMSAMDVDDIAQRLIPLGGTSGQVLTKNSGDDYDLTWTTPSGSGGTVTDVQINGTSILSSGVANITVDSVAISNSTNPLQSKTIQDLLALKIDRKGTSLAANTDLNDLDPGDYYCNDKAKYVTLDHKPFVVRDLGGGVTYLKFLLWVFDNNIQVAWGQYENADASLSATMYVRGKFQAEWSAWERISSVSPYTSAPAALGASPSAGSSAYYSRGDHVHQMPSAADVGAIAAPSSPSSGQFLVYNGSAWVAQSLSTWQGGNY